MAKKQPKQPKNNLQTKKFPWLKNTSIAFAAIFFGISITSASTLLYLNNRIYPGIYAANINLSTLTKEQALEKLNQTLIKRSSKNLNFTYQPSTTSAQKQKFTLHLTPQSLNYNSQKTIDESFSYGHQKFYPLDKLLSLKNIQIPLEISFNDSIDSQIKSISDSIDQPAIDASLKIDGDQITVSPSQDGKILDQSSLKKLLVEYLQTDQTPPPNLPIKTSQPKLSYEAALQIKNRLDEIKLTPIKLTFKDQQFILDLGKILSMIDLQNSQSSLIQGQILDQKFSIASANIEDQDFYENKLTLNETKVYEYLKNLSKDIDQDVQEPLFSVDPTSDPKKPKIKEFKPPQQGQRLLIDKAYIQLNQALLNPKQSIVELPVQIVPPKNQLVNELGIKELIGRGISNFSGSIPNRIFNIGLASSRLNGLIIGPGEEFSFVNTVGDISAATGYKQAYVIKSGRTVLDDGGGVCQVSTTLFRTVLNSGLPVTARTAHAYRVGYYEQGFPPGLDATIFSPSVDFRFKNDTPASILIQAYVDGLTLYVDFYGTSDGRIAQVTRPVIQNQTPPPPELRQDDPTLPKGTIKQVDFSAWGANVIFSRTVIRNGQTIINESFKSNYRPWQAVFLVGTGG